MPIKTLPLSDMRCRTAKPDQTRSIKLFDGGGLFLEIRRNGSKLWRLKYRHMGREKLLSLGAYPVVGLAEARTLREEAKRTLQSGSDPSVVRRQGRLERSITVQNTMEAVAREWLARNDAKWEKSYSSKIALRLEKDVFPALGSRPIAELEASDLSPVLLRIEARGAVETAHRVRRHVSEIFRYAIALGKAKHDVANDLRSLVSHPSSRHFASITCPQELARLLRAIYSYEGEPSTRAALMLAPMLFCRPGELRGMRWAELDLPSAEWRIPPTRQKLRKKAKNSNNSPNFIVPLSRQAMTIITELRPITGRSDFVFPSTRCRQRSMSDGTVNAALRRLGYSKERITGHGFRHTASTMLNEQRRWSSDAIERQLAHKDGSIRGIYNAAEYLEERVRMMQSWADYLDELRTGSSTFSLTSAADNEATQLSIDPSEASLGASPIGTN